MPASTTGSAQPKIKTINVEVNLLEAWVIQRVELESRVYKRAFLLVGILVTGMLAIPILASKRSETGATLRSTESQLALCTQEKSSLERQAKAVTPSIQLDEMVARCHLYSGSFLDELTQVINAAPNLMYFEQLQADMAGGECTMKILANAASPEIGREFVNQAGRGRNVLSSTQTSVRQSQLSQSSIKFDYIKKVSIDR